MKTATRGLNTAKRTLALGALLTAASLPAQAQIQQNVYLGIDLHNWSFDPDQGSEFSDFGIRGKLGAKLAERVAVEFHAATGGSDRVNGQTLELNSLFAGFVRGDIPISRYVSLYGLLGFASLNMDVNAVSRSDSSVSFGVGGDFEVARNTALNVDYIRYIGETDFAYSALSLGARWSF